MQKHRVKNSISASMKDGAAWAMMSGFADPYSVPFALAMGAGTMGVGVLRSFPALASAIFQIFTEKLVLRLGSCRRALLLTVMIQALSLFVSACAVFLPPAAGLPLFVAMAVVYMVAGNMSGPPWAVLMGEYIPASKRGNFFGFRSQLLGLVFFAGSFIASQLLGVWQGRGLWGFFLIFAGAGVFRLISFYYLTLMYEPRTCFHLPRGGAGVDFLGSLDFRRGRVPALFFSVLVLLFSTYLSAPYFSVYTLKELGCGYTRYMVLMTIGPLMTYLFMRRWGQAADGYGSVKILKAAFLLVPVVPLLWTLSRNFYYLAVVETFSGIIWGAYLIGMNNFLYESVPVHSRAGYNAFFSFTTGLAQFGGALLGGWLYQSLPPLAGSAFISLLLVSAALRGLSVVPLFWLVRETREVRAAGPVELLLVISGFKPLVR
jgi:MFS family permease